MDGYERKEVSRCFNTAGNWLSVISASTRFPGITVLSTAICIELNEGEGGGAWLFWENEPLKMYKGENI